jgi:hypothetical protein
MKTYFIIVAAVLSTLVGHAQPASREVTGRVTDNAGQPVSGVTVTNRASGVTTVTAASGAYRIRAAEGDVLVGRC